MDLLANDPNQALRCRRILMAGMAYAVWLVLGGFLCAVDLLRIGFMDLVLYFVVIAISNVTFFALVRTGLNRHLADPSMTFVHRIEATLRSEDPLERGSWPGPLGRFGGEEFLVVLRGSNNKGARRQPSVFARRYPTGQSRLPADSST